MFGLAREIYRNCAIIDGCLVNQLFTQFVYSDFLLYLEMCTISVKVVGMAKSFL